MILKAKHEKTYWNHCPYGRNLPRERCLASVERIDDSPDCSRQPYAPLRRIGYDVDSDSVRLGGGGSRTGGGPGDPAPLSSIAITDGPFDPKEFDVNSANARIRRLG